MTDVLETLQKLPRRSYATLNTDRRLVILIDRGVPGYSPIRLHDTKEQAEEQAKRLNEHLSVTPAQRSAMVHGSMFGWHTPSADPDNEINQSES